MEGEIILKFDATKQEADVHMALGGYKWYLAFLNVKNEIRNRSKYAETLKLCIKN